MVPVVVIPISLVGAFFIMYLADFSINVLSMLAVVLAIGLVVDDAIVVTENIYVKIESGMEPKQAGLEGSKEIFFAIVSTTITLIAVFFPIVFMEGMTGKLFVEFSIVISGAVLISSFVALGFSPMLATKVLKKRETKNRFYRLTEPFFLFLNKTYSKGLTFFLDHKAIVFPIVAVFMTIIIVLWLRIPSEMAPLEDRSQITISNRVPEGATYEYFRNFTDKISHMADSLVGEYVESNVILVRPGMGWIRLLLHPIADRDKSQMELASILTRTVTRETEARSVVQQFSTFGGSR